MMSWSNNGKMQKADLETGTIWDELMASTEEAEFLNRIEEMGEEDGRLGLNALRGGKGIAPAVQILLMEKRMQVIGLFHHLKNRVGARKAKLRALRERIVGREEQLGEQRKKVKLVTGMIYTIAGLICLLADVEFSRQIIVPAWQLGQDSLFGRWSLILGIAMTAVLLKLFYSRFIESRFEEGSGHQNRIVKVFFYVTMPLAVLFFLQIAYARGVIFKFALLESEIDVYESLYQAHPSLMTVSFVGVAFLYLLGGSVLLTVGLDELGKWGQYRRSSKTLRVLLSEKGNATVELNSLEEQLCQAEVLFQNYLDEKTFNQMVQLKTSYYESQYRKGYLRGRHKYLRGHTDAGTADSFHLYNRKLLDVLAWDRVQLTEDRNEL